jgi:UrcA family protein
MIVRYATQDLASEARAQHLLQRIESAAHPVCFDQDLQPLPLQEAAQRCYRAAVARAVDAVNAPHLRAAYVTKYGSVRDPVRLARRADG